MILPYLARCIFFQSISGNVDVTTYAVLFLSLTSPSIRVIKTTAFTGHMFNQFAAVIESTLIVFVLGLRLPVITTFLPANFSGVF